MRAFAVLGKPCNCEDAKGKGGAEEVQEGVQDF